MATPSRIRELVDEAFATEIIRDKILEFVIYHREEQVLLSNARRYRLVNRSWLQSVSRILLHLKQPLYKFAMRNTFTKIYDDDQPEDETALDRFVELAALNKHLDGRVPPFSLSVESRHLVGKNHRRVIDLFKYCGSGLVLLKLQMSHHHIFVADGIKLKNLHSLTLILSPVQPKQRLVIQSVFDASSNLKSLVVDSFFNHERLPDNLNTLVMPSSIEHVDLNSILNECHLEQMILQSPLSNIKSLKLKIIPTPLKPGVLSSILEKVASTLETLEIGHCCSLYPVKGRTTFELPLMPKLTKLQIHNAFLDLEGDTTCLEQLVPELNHVTLAFHLVSVFRKWTEGSCFESVDSLAVSLSSEVIFNEENEWAFYTDIGPLINFDVGTMTSLKDAFPNLVKLEISFDGPPVPSVFVSMMELTKLKALKIYVAGKLGQKDENLNVFDALLLGIPKDSVAALRYSPESFERLLEDEKSASIRNLTDLETLDMTADYSENFFWISPLSFEFAFLRMPRLANLRFCGGFYATDFMIRQWEKAGRRISVISRKEK